MQNFHLESANEFRTRQKAEHVIKTEQSELFFRRAADVKNH